MKQYLDFIFRNKNVHIAYFLNLRHRSKVDRNTAAKYYINDFLDLDLAKVKNYFFSLLSTLEPEAADDYTQNILDTDEKESDDGNDDQTGTKMDSMTTPYVMYLANVPIEMPNVIHI